MKSDREYHDEFNRVSAKYDLLANIRSRIPIDLYLEIRKEIDNEYDKLIFEFTKSGVSGFDLKQF